MIILIILLLLTLPLFVLSLRRKQVFRLFDEGNVIVFGLRGRGKDLLFSAVTNNTISNKKRKKKNQNYYISNINYTEGKYYIKFDSKVFNLNGNTFQNFTDDCLTYFDYPYPDCVDYFLSDAGVYYPSQYYSQLDKKYPSAPLFFALSRHLGNCNVHANVQNLNRLWDKIREQADTYIMCARCMVLFRKIAIQKLYIYDNYESALARRKPFPRFLFNSKEVRLRRAEFIANYGHIQKITCVHVIKHKYDDRVFKSKLLNGKKNFV